MRTHKPEVGSLVRVHDERGSHDHLCSVRDLLDTQFTAVYEVARSDGGWVERTVFLFYSDRGDTWSVDGWDGK